MSVSWPEFAKQTIGQSSPASAIITEFPYGFAMRNMGNDERVGTVDATLMLAHRRWAASMDEVQKLAEAGLLEQALAPAAEAIRFSAAAHPQYHFIESGLHTALGSLHLRHGEHEEAKRHFERAVFLHHDNAVALAGQGAAERREALALPSYTHAKAWAEWLIFCDVAQTQLKSRIFELWAHAEEAKKDAAISLYADAITLCDATHQHYHAFAAEPWWLRAALHHALGETLLAMNDLKRGLDLDRQNVWASLLLTQLAGCISGNDSVT